QPHRHVARLENCAHLHRERFAALVALVRANAGALAAHLGNALKAAAVRANRAFRPHPGFNPGVSGGFVVEAFGVDDGLAHDPDSLNEINVSGSGGYVKYNIAYEGLERWNGVVARPIVPPALVGGTHQNRL